MPDIDPYEEKCDLCDAWFPVGSLPEGICDECWEWVQEQEG